MRPEVSNLADKSEALSFSALEVQVLIRRVSGKSELSLLFLQPQPCIRTLNYAKALKHVLGSKICISLAHTGQELRTLYGYGEEYFDNVSIRKGESHASFVSKVIEEASPDIIHSHNAPDYLTIAAKKVSRGIPVVHDTHEVLSLHHSGFFSSDNEESLSRYALEEKAANEGSDARVYASHGIRGYIQSRYQVNTDNDLVFRNYVSRSCLPRSFKRKLSENDGEIHIAYVGCITSLLRESHYYLLNIFKKLASHKLHIHIHPTSNLITRSSSAYKELAAKSEFIHYHHHMDRRKLLKQLTRYDYGWAGLNATRNRVHLEIALPNKVIEYVACGLPVLAFPHEAMKYFIERNHVGIVGKNVDDLARQLGEVGLSEFRSNLEKCRQSVIIEEKIAQLIDFYRQLVEKLTPEFSTPRGFQANVMHTGRQ
jgi:glycosyltransferase involved in cell wall biosynthesis